MLPVLERLIYKPRETQVTRVLVLVPTRELGIQVHTVARQLAQFTSVTTCLAVGKSFSVVSFFSLSHLLSLECEREPLCLEYIALVRMFEPPLISSCRFCQVDWT